MEPRIKVYAKAQNRTALGIIFAYLKLHPNATLDELKRAFPDSLNPDSGVKANFVEKSKIHSVCGENWEGYFTSDDEVLHLSNGTTVVVVKMWTKPSIERLIQKAKEYGIVVENVSQINSSVGFKLELLTKKKPIGLLIGIVCIVLLIVALFCWLCLGKKAEPVQQPVQQVETPVAEVVDTVANNTIDKILKGKYNTIQFKQGTADLSESSFEALDELVTYMNNHPSVNILVEGHTSLEGDSNFNQKLSEKRAQAVVDYLISKGVDSSRLQSKGKGSSEPIDKENDIVNRRVEIIIL